jgi:hypothetical protein
MNVMLWSRRMGAGVGAAVFAALMAGSLGGCKLLKPKEKKAFGADCVTDLDCESLTCSTTGNICTKSCTYDADCGGDIVCRRKDDNSGNWCSKAIGTPPGGSCMNTWDCQHNECLKYVGKEDQPGLCTKYCKNSDDCPAGQKICEKISDTGMLKVCLPGDPAAAPSARPQFSPTPQTPRGTPAPRRQPTPPPQAQPQPQPRQDATPAKTATPTRHPTPTKRR